MAAAVVAILAVAFYSDWSLVLAPLAIAALAAAAALIPLPSELAAGIAGRAPANQPDPDVLSANEFAAALSDPVVFFDREGLVVDANQAATDTFGPMSAGSSLLLRFRAPEVRTLVEQAMAGDAPPPIEYLERLPVERLFRVSAPSVGTRKQLLALIFKDQSEARRIDRMRADFIANASHELRTPLASITGFIETLQGSARNDPKARAQFLAIMQDQTRRMARLLDDLLSLSRLEMRPRIDAGSAVDLRQVLDRVTDALSPLAKEYGVEIEKRFGAVDASIAGDGDELFQVFENLLENACKYGQSGGRVVVALGKGVSGPRPEVDVSVTDFGPGIAAEHIPRITERFYRVDVETSRQHKGTGLGLAIVKHILTRHGGRLSVRSEPGKGSTFTAHLPAGEKSNDG